MPEPLTVVDARELKGELRDVLAPGEEVKDEAGIVRTRPTHFYRVESWEAAREVTLAPYMSLYEFIDVDVREHPLARQYPRYVPGAVSLLAACLSALRQEFGTYLHVSANGGYRTPAHARSRESSCHSWGTAADIYRVGDDFLNDEETIARYADKIRSVMPGVRMKSYGDGPDETIDHLHLDLGYLVVNP